MSQILQFSQRQKSRRSGIDSVGRNTFCFARKRTLSSSGNSFSSNEFTGGITFNNYGGYEMLLGPGVIGGRFAMDVLQTDRHYSYNNNGNSYNITAKGGQSFAATAFYEWPINEWTWGADLGFVNYNTVNEVSSINGAQQTYGNGSQLRLKMEGYGTCKVTDSLTALVNAGYGPANSFIPNIEAASGTGIYVIVGASTGDSEIQDPGYRVIQNSGSRIYTDYQAILKDDGTWPFGVAVWP